MSHIALQHVIVRMLYDPAFVQRVYADPHVATADCDVCDDERAWLVRADRRAWSVDPYRRARSLTGLLEEYPDHPELITMQIGFAMVGIGNQAGDTGNFSLPLLDKFRHNRQFSIVVQVAKASCHLVRGRFEHIAKPHLNRLERTIGQQCVP